MAVALKNKKYFFGNSDLKTSGVHPEKGFWRTGGNLITFLSYFWRRDLLPANYEFLQGCSSVTDKH